VETVSKLLDHLGYATPLLYAAAAYGLFAWLDKEASDEAKNSLAVVMKLKAVSKQGVAAALVEAFDAIYTNPLLRLRAVVRSFLISAFITIVFAFEMRSAGLAKIFGTVGVLGLNIFSVFLPNATTDYLSLFLIRPMLKWCGKRPVLALSCGVIVFFFIVCVSFAIRAALQVTVWLPAADFSGDPRSTMELLADPETLKKVMNADEARTTVFFLAFIPGVAVFLWLPLYLLGLLTIRLSVPLFRLIAGIQWVLKDGKDHPLKAIGCVAAVAVFAAAAILQVAFE
jgi:hypothetical protein